MRAIVTGAQGFVGKYLLRELSDNGYEIFPVSRRTTEGAIRVSFDDEESLIKLISEVRPDCIFHLAAQSNVPLSWKEPAETFSANLIAAVRLLDAVRKSDIGCRILIVGSSDEYGKIGAVEGKINETHPLDPVTPYAISKKAQEEIALLYSKVYGMDIVAARAFNHSGAGQKTGFMITDFASGIVRIEKKQADSLRVGDLTAKRDFTHVKDVVRAYRLLAERGRSGEVYNIGSGVSYSSREILDKLISKAGCKVKVVCDAARMRASDTPNICCDNSKLRRETGWECEFSIDDIIDDVLEYYR